MNFDSLNIDYGSYSYQDLIGQRRENAPRSKPRSVTASGNVNPIDDLIDVDATSGAVTLTLETAIGCDGRRHLFKKTDSSGNAVTIACTGGQTIDGNPTASLAAQYDTLAVISNGVNWFAFAGYPITGGGGGTTINSGSATLDFGAFPGSAEASVAVAAGTIGAGSKAWAYFRAEDTSVDHTAADHKYAPAFINLTVAVTAGVGLTIYGRCLDNLQGKWTVRYGWFN